MMILVAGRYVKKGGVIQVFYIDINGWFMI